MIYKPPTGLVKATYPSTNPGSPGSFTYDVAYANEDGSETTVAGISSALQQPNVDVYPAKPGQPCGIHWCANQPFFMIHQAVYFKDCPVTEGTP